MVLRTEDVVRAAINRKLNTFVPAGSLPPEVLIIIFEFACCLNDDAIFTPNFTRKNSEQSWEEDQDPDNACAGTPLLIAKVCSVWRNIVLSAPKLWTNIIIYFENKRANRQAAMLQYWLSKSGQLPLNVEITQQGCHEPTESTAVIDVLVAHAHRFRSLDLFLPSAWESALNSAADCIHLLNHLILRFPADEGDPLFTLIEDVYMFADAPQLREVIIIGRSAAEVFLPWAQLESLESWYDSVAELVETLGLSSRLRCCKVDLGHLARTSFPQLITHTSLEMLEIFGHDSYAVYEICGVLTLPRLRSFVLRLDDEPLVWTPSLLRFLSYAGGALETLSLSNVLFEEEPLLETLRVAPKLRKLVLLNWYLDRKPKALTQRTLDLMNPNKCEGLGIRLLDGQGGEDVAGTLGSDERSKKHCLIPDLETFEYHDEIAFTPHTLVEFLVARWRDPSAPSELDGQ